jgi:hypothetical protein
MKKNYADRASINSRMDWRAAAIAARTVLFLSYDR